MSKNDMRADPSRQMEKTTNQHATTSQRSSTAYFTGTKNISRHEGIL
jgi:hypothetical protein